MIHCPNCGIILVLDEQSVQIDKSICAFQFGEVVPVDWFQCKGCKLKRPFSWWDVLQLDVDTQMTWEQKTTEEAVPEELTGNREAPWGD
jgi:hypothetical protein